MHKVWRGSHCPVWETILKTPRHNKPVWRSLSTPWQCVVASQDLKYAVFHTYHYLVLQHCSFWDWSNSSTTRTTKLIPKKKATYPARNVWRNVCRNQKWDGEILSSKTSISCGISLENGPTNLQSQRTHSHLPPTGNSLIYASLETTIYTVCTWLNLIL